MADVAQISEFGKILIFIITGFVLVIATLFAGKVVAPKNPNPEKLTSYECGEEPTGSAWLPFNSRFYVIALVFLLFDVEMVFIFPWATVFGNHELIAADSRWGKFSLIEMFLFVGILILGLVYVWVKGDLNWIRPEIELPQARVAIPHSVYDQLNNNQSNYKVKAFSLIAETEEQIPVPVSNPTETPAKRPMFKPSFKKPGNES